MFIEFHRYDSGYPICINTDKVINFCPKYYEKEEEVLVSERDFLLPVSNTYKTIKKVNVEDGTYIEFENKEVVAVKEKYKDVIDFLLKSEVKRCSEQTN